MTTFNGITFRGLPPVGPVFTGKYPVTDGPIEIAVPKQGARTGILPNIIRMREIEPPGGQIIDDRETLVKLWKFLRLPAKDTPNPDFSKERVLFIVQRCENAAVAENRKVVSLWDRKPRNADTAPTRLTFNRKDDILMAEVPRLPQGRDLAWYLAIIPKSMSYLQEADRSVYMSRLDAKTTVQVVPR